MDEVFLILVIVGCIVGVLVGSVLGFVANGRSRRLAGEMDGLRQRIVALETGRSPVARSAATAETEAPFVEFDERGHPIGPDTVSEPNTAAAEAEASPPDATETAAPDNGVEPAPEPATAEETGDDQIAASAAVPPFAAEPPPRGRDFEEALGSRWAVWVGGIALALGGIFLVRYSIEAGLIGPGMRIAFGVLFAATLLALGEWLRRSSFGNAASAPKGAYIPGILTAAGTVAAFATAYAAYILYGFLGDTAAFVVLGAVALATLALALVHGPGLAGLGLAASYATPLLVSSQQPAFGALSLYLLLVMAATVGVARLRTWRWLAITGVLGSVLWAMFMAAIARTPGLDGPIIAAFIAGAYAITHVAFVASVHPADPGRVVRGHDLVAVLMLAVFAFPVLLHIGIFGPGAAGIALLVGFGAAVLTTAYAAAPVRLAVIAGIFAVLIGYTAFGVPYALVLDPATGDLAPADLAALLTTGPATRMIGTGLILGLFFAGLGLFGVAGSASRTLQAVAASLIPLGLLVLAYLRIAEFEISVPFGFAALALAGYFGVVTDQIARRLPQDEHGVDGAVAAFAVMTVAALAAGLGMMFERGVLTIALAVVVPAIAMVEAARPVKGLRPIAVAVALVVCARFLHDPEVVGRDLGTTPVFNWLLYGYGVPAIAFGLAAWRFALTRDDRFVPVFEALAVAFTALTLVMLIHHAMADGDIYALVSGLAEQSLIAMSLMAVSLGMHWLSIRRPSPVFSQGTLLVGALGLAAAGVGLLFTQNPGLTGEPIDGGAFDGALILGYLLPAAMALVLARVAARRPERPDWYVVGASALAGLLAFTWATLAVRAAWHTGDLTISLFHGSVEEGELYAYSAVWLACGLALLAVGAVSGVRAARMVAAALVIAVVVKVFLIDTAGLTGALRAASFIGLGAVLVVVGLAYQRFLRRAA
ncbi:MAG TPA: DUF2339 domain-containing protein [Methylomirabilota bacterium]|nr:DUF2339 domain-containing protein [Methylomirabilota bacterium]